MLLQAPVVLRILTHGPLSPGPSGACGFLPALVREPGMEELEGKRWYGAAGAGAGDVPSAALSIAGRILLAPRGT